MVGSVRRCSAGRVGCLCGLVLTECDTSASALWSHQVPLSCFVWIVFFRLGRGRSLSARQRVENVTGLLSGNPWLS